jgi:hypothetical protein
MAHFAKINDSNIVTQVLVINDSDVEANGGFNSSEAATWVSNNFGEGTWKQVSYNTRFGKYYTPNTGIVDDDQSKSLRKNFPGVGSIYHSSGDGFSGPKPHDSWTLNSTTFIWDPPVAYPNVINTGTTLTEPNTGINFLQLYHYEWDEDNSRWIAKTYKVDNSLENNWIWNATSLEWEVNNG